MRAVCVYEINASVPKVFRPLPSKSVTVVLRDVAKKKIKKYLTYIHKCVTITLIAYNLYSDSRARRREPEG